MKNDKKEEKDVEDVFQMRWDIDNIPIISQVKYFLLAATGDEAGANLTRSNFLDASPLWMHIYIFKKRTKRSLKDVSFFT